MSQATAPGSSANGVTWDLGDLYRGSDDPRVDQDLAQARQRAEEAVKVCDENTIGVVAVLGSTFDGSYEPIQEICSALDDLQERSGLDVPVHVDGASGAFVAPFADPDLVWDFQLPRVASINASVVT